MTAITRISSRHAGHTSGSTFPDPVRDRLQFFGDQHMQVGVVAEQIAESLDGDDSAGHRINMFRAESDKSPA
jgi:hypothetical protein